MKTDKNFPNGFTSWMETFFEVAQYITSTMTSENFDDEADTKLAKAYLLEGTGGIYELAEELTDKFELQYEGSSWVQEGYFETLDNFLEEQLN